MPKNEKGYRGEIPQLKRGITTFKDRLTGRLMIRETEFSYVKADGSVGPLLWKSRWPGVALTGQKEQHDPTDMSVSTARENLEEYEKPREAKALQFLSNLDDRDGRVEEHKICQYCTRLLTQSLILNGRASEMHVTEVGQACLRRGIRFESFEHHGSAMSLKQSCRDSCHLCTLFWDVLDDQTESKIFTEGSLVVRKVFAQICTDEDSYDTPRRASINVVLRSERPAYIEQDGLRCIEIRHVSHSLGTEQRIESVVDDSHDYLLGERFAAQVSVSTESKGSFELATRWLIECMGKHQTCRWVSSSAKNFPARLIYIKNKGPLRVARIIPTSDLSTVPEYLTLSHCWGEVEVLRLSANTMEEFSNALPMHRLPKTFREAIDATCRLGFSYLWIDSLCILQDSVDDWASESAIMGDIYRTSSCTIAALAANDSNGGLYRLRNPLVHRPCVLHQDETGCLYAIGHGDPLEHDAETSEARLLERGWAFQERALSPRTLFFGAVGLSWQCVHGDATEWRPTIRPSDPETRVADNPKSMYLELNSMAKWSNLVSLYSSYSLTRPTDRLTAIHGIAKTMQEYLDSSYVAGIWPDLLHLSLLWSTRSPRKRRPKVYQAPTWSWASVNSPVDFPLQELIRGKAENLQGNATHVRYKFGVVIEPQEIFASPTHEGSRTNGQVSHGYLKLKAPLQAFDWSKNTSTNSKTVSTDKRGENDVWTRDYRDFSEEGLKAMLVARGFPDAYDSRTMTDDMRIHARVDVGLILRPLGTTEENIMVYERCGHFEQYFWSSDEYPLFAGKKLGDMTDGILIV